MEMSSSELVVNVGEYEALAKQRLPKMVYDFYAGGAEDQWTLQHNTTAFSTIRLRPRVLVDVSKVDISTSILGFKVPMPIMVAPTSLHRLAHPEGELATARAAASMGTIMALSFSSSFSLEEVAEAGCGVKFFQLYVYKDRKIAETLVLRAEKAGYKAIVLTGDTPRLGRREADIRNRFTLPPNVTMKNLDGLLSVQLDKSKGSGLEAYAAGTMDKSLSWKDIRWLKSITNLPILVKGILTAEDALLAVQAGVAGVIVSNHGARQLDFVLPSIMALEEVVNAVQGKIPVFLDGGVRRGTDIFKALALGAEAVLIGRPVLYGLTADGERGVKNVLQMLSDELELAMSLSGCCSVKDIKRSHVQTTSQMFASKL
ncbi:hypothetical protein GOP47_0016651 [Adiantum capillus-veneris]|uniref:(S)-2-hydroxy-acid oxidase n=1 Tax=Adiantum capillus-veneris TaxID=13818 RepID=A0A9D4ZD68_ADICA|nr:hypothetical protein GOP47_0016651 [Adiantum capillus-veneris]